jgi:N-acetylglucosamine repressor
MLEVRAHRGIVREINRSIVLDLIRSEQPISRADLARRMQIPRGMVTTLIDDLLEEGVVLESATANTTRGRKPTLLHIRTHDRYAIAVDVRFDRTHIALTDLEFRQLELESFPTILDPSALMQELIVRIQRLLGAHDVGKCEGIGVIVPGMVDRRAGVVLNSPQLGWRDVRLREALAAATGLRVFLENASIAGALAHLWAAPRGSPVSKNFAYVTVSDGVGVGLISNGEVVRGHAETAGEFGHVPIDIVNGVPCLCGMRGCWEAYVSNHATLCRYFELDPGDPEARRRIRASGFTIRDLVSRARGGDDKALDTMHTTAHYLGIGISNIITAFNPSRIIVGGEITYGWTLIGDVVAAGAHSRALTAAARATPVVSTSMEHVRLRGGVALLLAHRLGFSTNGLRRRKAG